MSLLDTASLIVTPNGYKEGKLYSVIPSDGSGDMSVVRATTATRVNSAGLVELVPYNLLEYSEQFDNAYWNPINSGTSTLPVVTANYAASPDGTQNADRIQCSADTSSSSNYSLVSTSVSPTLSSTGTLTIYLKSNTSSNQNVLVYWGGGQGQVFNVTPDWQRFTLSNLTAITTGIAFGTRGGSGNFFNGGDATLDILAWGAQLVEGTNALPYQKTETRLNIPRLDYSNGTCPSLLVEPQRTNVATYSEDFSAVGFTIDSSLSSNTTTAPSGIQSADSLIENTANGNHLYYIDYSVSSGTTYTYSVFCKSIGGRNVEVRSTNAFSEERAIINLSNGSIFSESTSQIAVEPYANGWYRISITKLASTSTGRFIIFALDGTSLSYQGNGTSGLYLWGAQLEVGSYSTSYIPTTSASVTRNADVISKTGISSLIGQTEGTFFIEINSEYLESYTQRVLTLFDGTSNNILGLLLTASNELLYYVTNGGTNQVIITKNSPAITLGQNVKIAAAYKANDFVLYVNGVQIGTDTSGSVPATSSINFANFDGSSQYVGKINATALWKTRLTNAQLATLTTI